MELGSCQSKHDWLTAVAGDRHKLLEVEAKEEAVVEDEVVAFVEAGAFVGGVAQEVVEVLLEVVDGVVVSGVGGDHREFLCMHISYSALIISH